MFNAKCVPEDCHITHETQRQTLYSICEQDFHKWSNEDSSIDFFKVEKDKCALIYYHV